MNDIQRIFDAISNAAAGERSRYHVTLGKMIELLSAADPELPVRFEDGTAPGFEHSYRGYYSDLAFERVDGTVLAKDFLRACQNAIGCTFEGYKGGDFTMTERTPLWASSYGTTGDAIVAATPLAGQILLTTKAVE